MVAIAAELKKGSGTTACQGVPFDLICFKLKSSKVKIKIEKALQEVESGKKDDAL